MDIQNSPLTQLRDEAHLLPESSIIEIADYSRGGDSVIDLIAG